MKVNFMAPLNCIAARFKMIHIKLKVGIKNLVNHIKLNNNLRILLNVKLLLKCIAYVQNSNLTYGYRIRKVFVRKVPYMSCL